MLCGEASLAHCPFLDMLRGAMCHPAVGLEHEQRARGEALVRQLSVVAGLDSSQEEALVATLLPSARLQIVREAPGTGEAVVPAPGTGGPVQRVWYRRCGVCYLYLVAAFEHVPSASPPKVV